MAAQQEDVLRALLDAAVLRPAQLVFIQSYQHEVLEKCKQGSLPLKRLASQCLAQAYRSQYRRSEVHVRALLAEACKELPDFPEIFSRVFKAKVPVLAASFAGARVIALRLACVVLDAADKDAAWLPQLLATLSRLLEATLLDAERSQQQARHALLKLLRKHKEKLLKACVAVLQTAAPEEQHFQLWHVLCTSGLLDQATQETFWEKYAFWAFESKKRSFAPLEKNDPRLKALSNEDFEKTVLPPMAKMLKKAPDTVIESVGELVKAAPLDFGRYLGDVFQPVLISKLRATKDDVRALAVKLAAALAHSFRESEHMQQFVVAMSALLDGKHGILAQFYQREVASAVLNDAADAAKTQLDASEVKEIAPIAIASLLKAVGKEAHEQTRHLGLLALGKWLALAGADELDAATVTGLKAGFKNKPEPVVAGYLRALAVLCRTRPAAVAPFADEALAVIKEANKKPNVVHFDGVLAIAVAGAIASASSELDARMAQEGVADLLLSSTSFVGHSTRSVLSTVASTSREGAVPESPEVSALAALSRALEWVLASQQSDASEAYLLLVELLCSSSLFVRQSAERAVATMYLSSLDHCAGLVVAFEKKVDSLTTEEEASIPPAGVLRRALRVLVPAGISDADATKAQVFAPVLFLAHHPFLVAGKKAGAFSREWQSIRRRFVPTAAATKGEDDEDEEPPSDAGLVDNFIEEHEEVKAAVVELLANAATGKLYSTSALQRLAAQRTLATLLDFAGNGEGEDLALHDVIEELLAKRLDDEDIDALTEEDVAICLTPFDELFEPKKEEDDEEETTRTRRGGRRGNEDEQWEQELREELERKKRAEQGAQKKVYTAEQKAQLEQQQELRRQVQETHRVVSGVLEAVDMLAVCRPDELHPALPYLLRSARVLSTCQLFKSEASSALFSMAKAICPALLRANYQDVASALRVALELNQLTSDKAKAAYISERQSLFLRLLAELMEYVFGFQFENESDFDADAPSNPIPPPTLHLLFPVLRDLLRFAPDLRRWALPLFAVHARMIPDEEEEEVGDVASQRLLRRDMLQLTLMLLAQQATGSALPITSPDLAPGKLLTSVCMGPELTASEWAPLLGDDGLLSEEATARGEVLAALLNVIHDDDNGEEFRSAKPSSLLVSRLYCCTFDSEEKNRTLAKQVWDATGAKVTPLFAGPLLVLLNHTHASVRESASLALADGMRQFPKSVTPLLNNLKTQFLNSQPKPMERKDEFGIPSVRRPGAQAAELDEDARTMCPRLGVALCLEKAAEVAGHDAMSSANTMALLTFVMEHGLGDPNAKVRSQMRKTGVQAVASLGGGANTTPLLEMFERFLESTAPPEASKAPISTGKKPKIGTHLAAQEEEMLAQRKQALSIYDHQREGVVVCLGSLAKHMSPSDPKVSSIVDSLIEALSIPSESVQRSVATCLSPLMGAVKDRSASILDDLLKRVTEGETFGERMGAAYGVSAVVKGLGISSLKIHNIIPRLEESMKTDGANARQGAMLVFECMSKRLGLLFEPYIIVILPVMLKCSADASPQVRESASHTAKGIMSNLSAHGVKLVLPSLLGALEESAWRTKQSGIQILGSMAYCAPRQLGSCLPLVVPKLMAALTDSHPKVREAGKDALRDVGSVVRNPEIATISKVLLDALEDPNRHTAKALQQLQSTSFQHSIDAPSLALVMPIITRGLKDRAGDAKKKAALIVGSMITMINDAKDLVPYMETVLPSLKTQLMDPIPEVRAVAAKALGKLVKGLGERHFADMLTWLLEAMKDDEVGPVERSGAAQGLCEVVVALGIERVERVMHDDILPLARHPKYSVREGVLWVMAFLPPALGKQFSMFLREALPIVVAGLSDEAESVRDVAMHSGHVVVNAHALTHTRDLLPSLEAGLFDDSWRIRQSSVMLLGDLMYRISGTRAVAVVSEDNDGDDDEASGSAAGDRAIIKLLGIQRRNAILASLYMIRSDTSAVVRQSALQVWKSVVANTPKTLRQILEALMNAIVSALSGDNMEKQTMAGRTLGEIVRKLGEHVLPEVVPILRAGLSPTLPSGRRQGACVGLAEVIDCCTKKQIEDYVDTLVDAVLDGVCDELPEVRASAAQAFDVLHRGIGYRAIDETVPMLLERIRSSPSEGEQERALLGLQEILRVKSREVLPYLIPRLLVTPVTASAARAVSRVAQATGAVIHFQVERIFATFFGQYVELLEAGGSDASKTELAEEIKHALRDVVLGVEAPGVHWLAIELCKYCESESVLDRALAFELVAEFCSHASVPYDDQAPLFLKQIVLHLNDSNDVVVRAASAALKGMNATTKPEQFAQHLDFIRQSINSMVSDARHRKGGVGDGEYLLPGLCIPKGLEPFLPSYQWALMNGSPELRQSAAAGLGELVELSSGPALRPYLIKLTGPLIRIAGDRFPGHVKAAILQTLEIILRKGGVALKPFLPQLQTTFVKALNDTAVDVRARGASALSLLVTLSPRVEPLLAELTERLRTTTGGVREANLEAVASVVERVGDKLSAAGRSTLEAALEEMLESSEDSLRDGACKCLASCVASTANSDLEAAQKQLLGYSLANVSADDLQELSWQRRQSAAVFTGLVLHKHAALLTAEVAAPLTAALVVLAQDEQTAVRNHALKAVGTVVKIQEHVEDVAALVPVLVEGVTHKNKDVIRGALRVVKVAAKRSPEQTREHLTTLVPALFQLIKSNNMAVKLPAERTLLYLLEVHSRPETQAEYLRSGAADAKIIGEYARRVLSKLKADSGDESE